MFRHLAVVVCVLAVAAGMASDARAQQPAPPAPAAQSGKAPALAFAAETGILLSPIVTAEAAVFEEVMDKVKQVLAQSPDPVRKQQAAGWRVFKAAELFQGATLYVSIMDPAVKGAEYNVFELLQSAMGDAEAREMFQRFRSAFAGPQHVLNLTAVTTMAQPEK